MSDLLAEALFSGATISAFFFASSSASLASFVIFFVAVFLDCVATPSWTSPRVLLEFKDAISKTDFY